MGESSGMECIGILIVFALVVIVAVAIAMAASSNNSPAKTVYERVAARFGAVRVAGTTGRQVQLKFKYRDEEVRVFAGGSTSRHWIQASLPWADPATSFEFAQRGASPSAELANAPLVPLPGEWNRYYTLRATDVDAAKRFLSAAVLWRVRELDQAIEGISQITIHRGTFTVAKTNFALNVDRVDRFLRIVLQTYDLTSLIDAKGIEFVDDGAEIKLDDAKCGVCGDKTIGGIVLCSRCKTPHHKECWEYMGGCSLYACGGKSWITPEQAGAKRGGPSPAK
jgi:hypothetical protein